MMAKNKNAIAKNVFILPTKVIAAHRIHP